MAKATADIRSLARAQTALRCSTEAGKPAEPHTGEDDREVQVTIRDIVEERRQQTFLTTTVPPTPPRQIPRSGSLGGGGVVVRHAIHITSSRAAIRIDVGLLHNAGRSAASSDAARRSPMVLSVGPRSISGEGGSPGMYCAACWVADRSRSRLTATSALSAGSAGSSRASACGGGGCRKAFGGVSASNI